MNVQAESFHLNGHIIGFRLQTQKSVDRNELRKENKWISEIVAY